MQPTIGRTVHYVLSQADVDRIIDGRADAISDAQARNREVCFGDPVAEGDILPMIIVKVHETSEDNLVNGHIFLDGTDVLWRENIPAATLDDGYIGRWSWPPQL